MKVQTKPIVAATVGLVVATSASTLPSVQAHVKELANNSHNTQPVHHSVRNKVVDRAKLDTKKVQHGAIETAAKVVNRQVETAHDSVQGTNNGNTSEAPTYIAPASAASHTSEPSDSVVPQSSSNSMATMAVASVVPTPAESAATSQYVASVAPVSVSDNTSVETTYTV